MKKVSLFLLPLFMAACSTDKVEDIMPASCTQNNSSDLKHYITFKTEEAFEQFILDNQASSKTRALTSVNNDEMVNIPVDFKPINEMMAAYNDEDPEIVDTEMSIDEFNVMKAEELILDSTLYCAMDTSLMVKVRDRIYKVTQYGTFSALSEAALKNAINNFNTDIVSSTENGTVTNLGNNVEFINSFGKIKTLTDDDTPAIEDDLIEGSDDVEDTENSGNITRSASPSSLPEFHKAYNCLSWKWKNNSVWQKIWDWARGKDVTKENYFDKTHRVQVELFGVNYGFYASSGIKVKMQKRKKFLFFKRWVSCGAQKTAVGFNKVYGTMEIENPIGYGTLVPTANVKWAECTAALNGVTATFVSASFPNIPFLKDWSKTVYAFIPKVTMAGKTFPNYSLVNTMYDAPANAVAGFLKSQTNKYIFTPTQKRIQERDPRLAYLMWGKNNIAYNKIRPLFMGVVEYDRNSKNVYFDRSFGFSLFFNGSSVTPGFFLPSKFDIKDIDAFGAAKYNGQWKGVRMYK